MNNQIDPAEVNAIITALQGQRNQALDQLTQAFATITLLQNKLKEYEEKEKK
jgi:hypothetical protein